MNLVFAAITLLSASPAISANAQSYEGKLADYRAAQTDFKKKSGQYWAEIARKRDIRAKRRRQGQKIGRDDFVLTQPPQYDGPSRPKNPAILPRAKPSKKAARSMLPRADDLRAAIKDLYGFELPPYSEKTFKRSFAREAIRHNLSAEQVIGVYALETGGVGPFDRVSGEIPRMSRKCRVERYVGRPLSTALGYFQLLNANTSSTLASNMRGVKGERITTRLLGMANENRGKRKRILKHKAKLVEKITADMNKAVARLPGKKNNWAEYRALGRTKLGAAIHALNLDPDIGPMIQITKLAFVRNYAVRKGLGNVRSDKLELMNLVGFPRGALMLTGEAFFVPTANFVQPNEINANFSVLGDKTVEESVAKIRRVIEKRKQECGSQEFLKIFEKLSS